MKLSEIFNEFYRLKFGREFSREARSLDEVFLFFVFSDYFGLPTPYRVFLIEMYPELVDMFHDWHKRMGMESSPLEWIKCC